MRDEAVVSARSTEVSPEEDTVEADEKSWVGGIGQLFLTVEGGAMNGIVG
jgi:hypothetical protein